MRWPKFAKRRIVSLGLEARYYLSKQYLDAGMGDEKVRPLFLGMLRTAAAAADLNAHMGALSNAALRYFQNQDNLHA